MSETVQRRTTVIVVALAALSIPTLATAAGGATAVIYLSEVGAGLTAEGDKYRQWFDIRLMNWGPAQLAQWRVSINPASFTTQNGGTMTLAREPCCSDEWCEQRFGTGATCNTDGGSDGLCTPAFYRPNHPGWSFDPPAVPIAAPYLTFSAVTDDVGPVVDDGATRYGGTLVVDLSGDSILFEIEVLPDPDTFMQDAAGQSIPLLAIESGWAAVPTGRCCRLAQDDCLDGVPSWLCSDPYDLWEPWQLCADGCLQCLEDVACTDGNACTSDVCNMFTRCVHTPTYDDSIECCVPQTGLIFGPSAAELDPCKRLVCNESNQTYSIVQRPQGSYCADGDVCTHLGRCTADGACVGEPASGHNCPKSRYLSFDLVDVQLEDCNDERAVRVTFVDLPGYEQFNGETRWLSAPGPYPEIHTGEAFNGATLQCDPLFHNFGPADLMHVFGAGVIPGATYEVQTVDTTCVDLNDPGCYSDPLTVQTGKWGDVATPFWAVDESAQPDFTDIAASVESFLAAPGAAIKARAQLQPNVPDPNLDVDFNDIAEVVAAFVTSEYPYDGPNPCF